ncbi:MAG TPA: hypothetical protein VIV83_07500 [Gemmatimonadales bacterium]|jgi:hypothetical protein
MSTRLSIPDTPLLLMGRPWDGYGDAIEAARYVPLLSPHIGARTLVVGSQLARLFGGLGLSTLSYDALDMSGAQREIEALADVLLLSNNNCGAPRLFRNPGWGHDPVTTPEMPYPINPASLWIDSRITLPPTDARRVGLCWSGASCRVGCAYSPRDLLPEHLAPLLRVSDLRFVALHYFDPIHRWVDHGPALRNLPECRARWVPSLTELGVTDWADTAGVVQQLDLVITTDTAIAHLAGSLGVRTWLLLCFAHDPRWGTGDTTPLYPTVRIFRQVKPGDWGSVIDRVRVALEAFAK